MRENKISKHILDSSIEVHRTLGGPGLLESVYEEALVLELTQRGLHIERQCQVPITYKGCLLATPLRLDLIVENIVIVEVKALTTYNTIFEAQALTYLRLMNLRLALVINFGAKYLKDGFHRVINTH
ncbi:MAG: GxxExxY protein [Chloroflexota bacterium]